MILGLRVPVIILVFILGLGGLLGLNYAYQYSRVDQPLNRYFAQRADVREFHINERGGRLEISVSLQRPVSNLREAYLSLEKGVGDVLGNRRFRLNIVDNRDARLLDDYYRLHYSLQEALSTGQFSAMAMAVSDQGSALGLDEARVFVDERYLYLQLRRGDRYLYERLPRLAADQVSELDVKGGRGG